MVILWIINLVLLIAIICSLKYDIEKINLLVWKRNQYRSWLLVRLFMGAGMLWVFGSTYRIPIFASLFALQGVLIFFVMVIYRKHVKRKLGGRKCGCFHFPQRWQKLPTFDEDDIPINLCYQPEEEELATTILLDLDSTLKQPV